MTKTALYAVLSVLAPLVADAFFFLAGIVPARLSSPGVYATLLVFHAIGFLFSVLALHRSGLKPTDVSSDVRLAAALGSIGLFVNTVAVEYILAVTVFPIPPAG